MLIVLKADGGLVLSMRFFNDKYSVITETVGFIFQST